MRIRLNSPGVLIVVDVQRDFCPGGLLAVSGGDEVVPVLNHWIEQARQSGAVIVASRDWHPPHHLGFKERGEARFCAGAAPRTRDSRSVAGELVVG